MAPKEIKNSLILNVKSFEILQIVKSFFDDLYQAKMNYSKELNKIHDNYHKKMDCFFPSEYTTSNYSISNLWSTLMQEVDYESKLAYDSINLLETVISEPINEYLNNEENNIQRKYYKHNIFESRIHYSYHCIKESENRLQHYAEKYLVNFRQLNNNEKFKIMKIHNDMKFYIVSYQAEKEYYFEKIMSIILQDIEVSFQEFINILNKAVENYSMIHFSQMSDVKRHYSVINKNKNIIYDIKSFLDIKFPPTELNSPISNHLYNKKLEIIPIFYSISKYIDVSPNLNTLTTTPMNSQMIKQYSQNLHTELHDINSKICLLTINLKSLIEKYKQTVSSENKSIYQSIVNKQNDINCYLLHMENIKAKLLLIDPTDHIVKSIDKQNVHGLWNRAIYSITKNVQHKTILKKDLDNNSNKMCVNRTPTPNLPIKNKHEQSDTTLHSNSDIHVPISDYPKVNTPINESSKDISQIINFYSSPTKNESIAPAYFNGVLKKVSILKNKDNVDPIYNTLKFAADKRMVFNKRTTSCDVDVDTKNVLNISERYTKKNINQETLAASPKINIVKEKRNNRTIVRMKSSSMDILEYKKKVKCKKKAEKFGSDETVNPKPKNLKGCQLNRSTTMDSKSVHFSKDAMRRYQVYVVCKNYKSKSESEISLKINEAVLVLENKNEKWWKGNCNQKIGYFPSNCVTELDTNEKPVRVKCQIELNEDNNKVFLVPEQIVFKVSDDLRGNAIIRVGKAKLSCPNKYLKDM